MRIVLFLLAELATHQAVHLAKPPPCAKIVKLEAADPVLSSVPNAKRSLVPVVPSPIFVGDAEKRSVDTAKDSFGSAAAPRRVNLSWPARLIDRLLRDNLFTQHGRGKVSRLRP